MQDRGRDPNRQVSPDAWARLDAAKQRTLLAVAYRVTGPPHHVSPADHIRQVNDAVQQRKFGPFGEPGDPTNEQELSLKRATHWSAIMAKGTE